MDYSYKTTPPAHPVLLSRERFLKVVRVSIEVEEFRYARETVLDWLASFPGDLEAGLLYAKALMGEGHIQEAIPILSGLCIADPEYKEAAVTWLEAETCVRYDAHPSKPKRMGSPSPGVVGDAIPEHLSLTMRNLQTYVYALMGEQSPTKNMAGWGQQLLDSRMAMQNNEFDAVSENLRLALQSDPPLPLAAVMHLHYLQQSGAPLDVRLKLAHRYQSKWADCLVCSLYLADWTLQSGDSVMAVALLHQVAARDIGAQVASRLWGTDNPYRDLWPTNLELALRYALPAKVTSLLGWNRLAAGKPEVVVSPPEVSDVDAAALRQVQASAPKGAWAPVISTENESNQKTVSDDTTLEESTLDSAPNDKSTSGFSEGLSNKSARARKLEHESLIQGVEEMAKRHNLPGLTRLDGRFPVYVVFSTRSGLQKVYGPRAASVLEKEMMQLVDTIQKLPGWGAQLFLADDPARTTQLGIRPAKPDDPWALKLALADLDASLAAQGEMIGAVLIVGDAAVVPLHSLPNPLDDQDDVVSSDNPYATRDKNYFIPEWPVGRLPSGGNPKLLLYLLQKIRKSHAASLKKTPWYKKFLQQIKSFFFEGNTNSQKSFGYSAAVWREAAQAVFRPIGNPKRLQISPPRGVFEGTFLNPVDPVEPLDGMEGGVPLPVGQFGYFNLHGLIDAPEWYGQRDPLKEAKGPDYPVALRPEDIEIAANGKTGRIPLVVFSEACYGLHIEGKSIDQAIALKFLQSGSIAVAGSTAMAYGSVDTPLVAADLLGHAFWRAIQDGVPAGEALRQAKIVLADEMDNRQGFLDGEDQKTLISFILYGDPLAQVTEGSKLSKGVLRLATPLPEVKTVCDRVGGDIRMAKAPADVLTSVREVVSHYLPGMSDADVAVAYQHPGCSGDGHLCPTGQLSNNTNVQCKAKLADGRRLVTLSKKVPRTEGIHTHYARLTLNEQGELLKLVVSR